VENSPLDKEARERGTSVYLVDRVIPMIPHKLSNGICSLNQGVDRLALSCIMKINEKGEIIDHEVVETLIRVDRRMTYTAVNEIITDKKQETIKEYEEFVSMFELMAELSEILRERRYGRGAIDFDFPECKIKLDEKGHPFSIEPYDRNAATKLIEDFMLAANETIAEYYFWQQVPFVYRNHEEPDSDRMKELALFITNFGYHVKVANDQIHPKELQKLLKRIEKTPEEAMISRVTLRSMKRAEYASTCTGHFGLAAKYYCHFTSPIRRYPDLQIHRIIKECLNGKMSEKHREHYRSILPEVTKHCSMTERRADDAERDTEKVKKAEYMRGFIGEEFTGVISGVTNFGVYVELPDTVEGLVHVSNITDDHYIYDEASYSLVGEKTKKTYKLGQTVKIRVEGADKIAGTIDFSMV
jgi:ribonuclease R